MRLHITILITHTVTFTIASTLVFRAFKKPTLLNLELQSYARLVLFISTGVVQVILIYLILQMTKPINLEESDSDDPSLESQDKREQDLTMMHYIRHINREVKLVSTEQRTKRSKKQPKSDTSSVAD